MDSTRINVTTITNNNVNISEFGTTFLMLKPNRIKDAYDLGHITEFLPLGQLQYRNSKPNQDSADWHVEPDPFGRLIIYLSGKYKITVGTPTSPESRIFTGGDILFFNDQIGLGHITEVLEAGIALTYKFAVEVKLDSLNGITSKLN